MPEAVAPKSARLLTSSFAAAGHIHVIGIDRPSAVTCASATTPTTSRCVGPAILLDSSVRPIGSLSRPEVAGRRFADDDGTRGPVAPGCAISASVKVRPRTIGSPEQREIARRHGVQLGGPDSVLALTREADRASAALSSPSGSRIAQATASTPGSAPTSAIRRCRSAVGLLGTVAIERRFERNEATSGNGNRDRSCRSRTTRAAGVRPRSSTPCTTRPARRPASLAAVRRGGAAGAGRVLLHHGV